MGRVSVSVFRNTRCFSAISLSAEKPWLTRDPETAGVGAQGSQNAPPLTPPLEGLSPSLSEAQGGGSENLLSVDFGSIFR